jgi:hypothetical protein
MTRFVTRALQTVHRYNAAPEQIDYAILAAINATLCLCSGGDDQVAEGFNHDIAANGRLFHSTMDYRGLVASQVMQRELAN